MSSTYTPSLTLTQIGNGEQSGTWGTTTNTNWQLIEDAVAGVASVTVSGTSGATLSVANGATDQSRKAVLVVTGSTSGTNAIVAPLEPKVYVISNQTTGGFNITIGASTGSVVTIPNGVTTLVYCDGTNFYSGITGFTGGNLNVTGNITASGTISAATFATSGGVPQLAGGTTGQIPYQTGANATSYITAPPSTGSSTFLSYIPGTGFNWQTSSTTASNINGGSANELVYQTGSNTTSFINAPSGANQVLTYNGSQIVWTSGGSVSAVNATAPLASSGGTTPTISISSSTGTGNVVLSASPTFTGTVNASGIQASYLGLGGSTGSTNYPLEVQAVGGNPSATFYAGTTVYGTSLCCVADLTHTTGLCVFQSGTPGSPTVAGSINLASATSVNYATTSDRRLKTNISTLTNSGSFIDSLLPRTFNWVTDGASDSGFIADELQQIAPKCVSGNPNEIKPDGTPIYQNIDPSTPEMIANMVAELQSLRKRVAALEAK